MSDATGLLALGEALDDHLSAAYAPPPGTQTALGFVPGIAVNPSSFAPTGVVNPMAVQTFLSVVTNVLGPVVDGRFSGFLSAASMYGALINLATPVDPLGSPAADAVLRVVGNARSAFGGGGPKDLLAVPLNWYDAASPDGWSRFTTTATSRTGEEGSSSSGTGDPPPTRPEDGPLTDRPRFATMWRWRNLDLSAVAQVVVPPDAPPVAVEVDPPPVVAYRRWAVVRGPVVHDRAGVDLSETSTGTRRRLLRTTVSRASADLQVPAAGRLRLRGPAIAAGSAGERRVADAGVRILAAGSRRQLTAALARDDAVLVDRQASTRLAELIKIELPAVVADIDDDRETSSTQSVESEELTLSLEYCFVKISRDGWWDDAVLRTSRWYAPGQRAGELSSGTAVGGLPLGVPIAMVLTRDVTVSGRWAESDRSAAESHSSFGPWTMQDAQLSYDASSETATLTMPGTQVVAVVCAVLPTLPPCDDPSLPPVPADDGPGA